MALVEMEKLLNVHEASKMLGIKWRTLYNWTAAGKVPCVKEGRVVRWRYSALLAWMGERAQ